MNWINGMKFNSAIKFTQQVIAMNAGNGSNSLHSIVSEWRAARNQQIILFHECSEWSEIMQLAGYRHQLHSII